MIGMDFTVTCVYDEGAMVDTPLIGARGSAMLVDIGGKRVLFDTGLRDRYLTHNLEHLDVDPESIDALVVSQRRPDNCRAVNAVLGARESPLDIYAPPGLYGPRGGLLSKGVSVRGDNLEKVVLHDLNGWMDIVPGVVVTPMYGYTNGYEEAFLVIDGRPLTVLSGRGVAGPSHVLDTVSQRFGRKVGAFIGSVLLEKMKKPTARQYASEFEAHGCTELHLNHCTGTDGMTNLRVNLGLSAVDDFYVGMRFDSSKL